MKGGAQPLASYNKSGTAQDKAATAFASWGYQKPACSCAGDKTAWATNLTAWAEPSISYLAVR